jgi:hypothetical protein
VLLDGTLTPFDVLSTTAPGFERNNACKSIASAIEAKEKVRLSPVTVWELVIDNPL